MLEDKPSWTFLSRRVLTQLYGHVHLLEDRVLGQWLCLDRSDGKLIWQRRFFRPNTIRDVDGEVIVATESRSDGSWTAGLGCYGISLATGRLLWTSHGRGLWGQALRLLDFVPWFTNDLRDSPKWSADGECHCDSGRVLDVRTGKTVRKMPKDRMNTISNEAKLTASKRLYDEGRVQVSENGCWLSNHARQPNGSLRFNHGRLRLSMTTPDGAVRWSLDVTTLGCIDGNYYSYRFVPPFIYLLVSDEDNFKAHPTKSHYVLPNPTFYRLTTVDVNTGHVVQEIRLTEQKVSKCRIEDADECGLLISSDGGELRYYRRM